MKIHCLPFAFKGARPKISWAKVPVPVALHSKKIKRDADDLWARLRNFPNEVDKSGSVVGLRECLGENIIYGSIPGVLTGHETEIKIVASILVGVISSRLDDTNFRDLAPACEAFRECCRFLKIGNVPMDHTLLSAACLIETRLHRLIADPADLTTAEQIQHCHDRITIGIADLDPGIDRYESFLDNPLCILSWRQFPHFEILRRQLDERFLDGAHDFSEVLTAIESFCLASPLHAFAQFKYEAAQKPPIRGIEKWCEEYFYIFTKLMQIFGRAVRDDHVAAQRLVKKYEDLFFGSRVPELGNEAIGFYLELFPSPAYNRRMNPTQLDLLRGLSRAYVDEKAPLYPILHGRAHLASSLRHSLRCDWAIELFYKEQRIRALMPHRPDVLGGVALLQTEADTTAARRVFSRLVPSRKEEIRKVVKEWGAIFDPKMKLLPQTAEGLVEDVLDSILGKNARQKPDPRAADLPSEPWVTIDAALGAGDQNVLPLIEKCLRDCEASPENRSINHATLMVRYAIALSRAGRAQETENAELQALAMMQRLSHGETRIPIALLNLGSTYARNGQPALAEQTYLMAESRAKRLADFAEKQFPNFYFILDLRLAQCLADAGRYDAAENRLTRALDFYDQYRESLNDDVMQITEMMIAVFIQRKRWQESLPFINRLASLNAEHAATLYKAVMLASDESEDNSTAIEAGEKGLALHRNLAPLQILEIEIFTQTLANIHAAEKNWAKALPYALEARRIRLAQTPPTDSWWHQIYLVEMYFGVGRRTDGIRLLQGLALSLGEDDREDRTQAVRDSIVRYKLQRHFPNLKLDQ